MKYSTVLLPLRIAFHMRILLVQVSISREQGCDVGEYFIPEGLKPDHTRSAGRNRQCALSAVKAQQQCLNEH